MSSGRPGASGPGLQPHAEAHPSDPVEQEVDAEQGSEDINAVERPMAHNNEADQDCDRGGEKNEAARVIGGKLRGEPGADHAGGDEARAEEKRERDRGENRVDDAHDSDGDIEKAADHPEKKLS